MNTRFHARLVPFVRRITRPLATLAVLPALVLGPLAIEGILIHHHHEHDLHSHSLAQWELDAWRNNAEYQHQEHEHGGPPVAAPADGCCTIVIVLDLPRALPGVRGTSSGTVAVAGIGPFRSHVAATADAAANIPPLYACASSLGPNLRAGSAVVGILLSNHALLL